MDFELQDGSRRVHNHIPDYVLITCGSKDGSGLVRVVECKIVNGEVEPIRVVEAWDDEGVDAAFPPQVPSEIATWLCTSKEVQLDLERLASDYTDGSGASLDDDGEP
jgi:hypothetical protein